MVKRILNLGLLGLLVFAGCERKEWDPKVEKYAYQVSSLVDPAKLAPLRERGADPRVQKYVAQLAEAKMTNVAPEAVAIRSVEMVGMKGDAAELTAAAMVRNLKIAEELDCLDVDGLKDMRKGQSPTIKTGPYMVTN